MAGGGVLLGGTEDLLDSIEMHGIGTDKES